MTRSFRLVGIDPAPFEPLFALSDEELRKHSARRCFATEDHGYPCRISLEDADVGDELLLLPYLHQPAASPYRASGPIYVRRGVKRRQLRVGEVPNYVSSRLISVRAYDAEDMMVAASVCDGAAVAVEIEACLRRDDIAYIQLHNARRGCFSCEVVRA